jgi:hypothetical protein
LAGDITGSVEPGLIMTPTTAASDADDGYLSASRIAGLKLDADWTRASPRPRVHRSKSLFVTDV